jgi:NTP pyrophosphatase (non-canonical NTP hydrolase)
MQSVSEATEISRLFASLGLDIHDTAVEKGFWDFKEISDIERCRTHHSIGNQRIRNMIVAEKLALVHSEISEALEAVRDTTPTHFPVSKKIPPFTNLEEELADAIIRILDLAEFIEADVGGAIVAKLTINKGRPFKHGREF